MNKELMKSLKYFVARNSVSDLQNIHQDDLMEVLKVDLVNLTDFLMNLEDERLLSFKYNCKCYKCNNRHTIYKRNKEKEIFCDGCEELIEVDKLISKNQAICSLDKKEIIEFELEEYDYIRAQEVNKIIKVKKWGKKMKIFLGSSKEAINIMNKVALTLEENDIEVVAWNKAGLFVAGNYTLDTLIDIANDVDAAIFIFGEDDQTWFREEEVKTVRDNVLLEYGLFTGSLSRKKVIFVIQGTPKIASDLSGVTYLKEEGKDFKLKAELSTWIDSIK